MYSSLVKEIGKDGVSDLMDEATSYHLHSEMIKKVLEYFTANSITKEIDVQTTKFKENNLTPELGFLRIPDTTSMKIEADKLYVEILNSTIHMQSETGRNKFVIVCSPDISLLLSVMPPKQYQPLSPSTSTISSSPLSLCGRLCYDTMQVFRNIYSTKSYLQIINVADLIDDTPITLHVKGYDSAESYDVESGNITHYKMNYDLYAKDIKKYVTTLIFK